jgi:hypothetical protein
VPDAPSRYSSALVRRELETGQERVIDQGTYSLRRIAISPDDRQVAFLAATSLRVVSAEGGQAREVFNRAANGLGWSSDGRYLLVTSNDELLSVPVAGGEPKPTGLKVGYWMSVHPDGRRIAFVPPMNEENAIVAIKNLVVGRKSER